jgi:drug/metabolite transporter (DMT)-like permease
MIETVLLLSIATMLLWAFTDFLAKFVVNSLDHRASLFLVEIFAVGSALFLLPLALPLVPSGAKFLWFFAFAGASAAIGAAAWLFFYRGMQAGKLSVTQPISALWVGLTVLLSFVFLGEKLPAIGITGLLISLVGVFLISFPASGKIRLMGKDALFGLLAMCSWGVGMVLMKPAVSLGGPFAATIAARLVEISVLAPLCLPVLLTAARKKGKISRRTVFIAAVIGIFNTVAFLFYNIAIQTGGVSIPTAVNAAAPAFVVLLSYIFHKERLSRRQLVGVALGILGLVLLSL